jgi:hypothetical protein
MHKAAIVSLFVIALILFFCENPSKPVPPELSFTTINDTTVRIGDDFNVGVDVINGSYWGMHFIWHVDNVIDTSNDFKRTFNWQFGDTGTHTIIVSALDQRMLLADPETLKVTVRCRFPIIDARQNDTTILWGDTLRINPLVSDSDGTVKAIKWKTDLDSLWYSAPPAGRVFVWDRLQSGTHLIRMRAVDDNDLMSTIDSVVVQVKHPIAKIQILENDTTVQLMSPLSIHTAFQGVLPRKYFYRWMVDSTVVHKASVDSVRVVFGDGQTGRHTVKVFALNADSSTFSSDTIEVIARYVRVKPELPIKDTSVYVNVPLTIMPTLNCQPQDIDSVWFTLDNKVVKKMRTLDTLKLQFKIADTGVHIIQLHALDMDGIYSSSEKVYVIAKPGYPSVKFPADTVVRGDSTFSVSAIADDINGVISRAQWLNNGNRVDSNLFIVTYKGELSVTLSAAVQDNDSLWAYDTMTVHFNAPPEIDPHSIPNDTLFCTESNPVASTSIRYSAFDKDNDTLTIECSITKRGIDTTYSFKGHKDSVRVTVNGPGMYHWTLKVMDSFGCSTTLNDSFTVVVNHTICFVGHSIVSGMAGDGQNGGFRAMVLKGLRENLVPFHNIKAVGPLTTPDMVAYPADDSCYAISGSRAYEMHFFLRTAYKKLNADMWVIMLGANAQYSTAELRNTIAILDTISNRNTQSKIYILTSPPFPDVDEFYSGNYYRTYFNEEIYDSVAVRKQRGGHISVVDVDTLLTDTNQMFDSTWFADHVHPNMKGYVRIGEKILSVMKSAENPAMKSELYRKEE